MAIDFTAEQKQAVTAAGGAATLVSAAAGSGKTAVLVERVVRKLADSENPTPANKLLIVTFTRAAAAEMSERISKRLAEEAVKNPKSKWIKRQQLLLPAAKISTIDSFCLDLAREYFFKTGLDYGFKLAEGGELLALEEKALTKTFENMHESGQEDFETLLETVFYGYDDLGLKSTVKKIYAYIRSLPFPEDWLNNTENMYNFSGNIKNLKWAEIVLRFLEQDIDDLYRMLEGVAGKITFDDQLVKCCGSQIGNALFQLDNIHKALKERDFDKAFVLLESFEFMKYDVVRNPQNPGLRDEVKELKSMAEKRISDALSYLTGDSKHVLSDMKSLYPVVKTLIETVRTYNSELEELKQEKGLFDFADIEHKVKDLLVEKAGRAVVPTELGREIALRFSEVMVDEYQDTNALQDLIFWTLSQNGKNLFIVGDAKQSIYRFRQADPSIFINRRRAYPLFDGTVRPSAILLSSNFRSCENICNNINFFFSALMSEKLGDIEYNTEEFLIPKAKYAETNGSATEVHIIETEKFSEELEARHIAGEIKKMLAKEKTFDRKINGYRPLKLSDFCILIRDANTRGPLFKAELEKQGIPAFCKAFGKFFDELEIQVVLSFLKVINNPLQDVPLLTVLLSPIMGLSPDDVVNIRAAKKEGRLYSCLVTALNGNDEKAKQAFSLLSYFRKLSVTLPISALIDRIFDVTSYYAACGAMADGDSRQARLRLFCQMAENYEANSTNGLSGFIHYIDSLQKAENAPAQSDAIHKTDDAVTIMSIHRAKGLEFPVCFLAAASRRFTSEKTDPALLHSLFGIGLYRYDQNKNARFPTLQREAIKLETERSSLSEMLRLLYVALTRAKERLIIISSHERLEKKLKELSGALERSGGLLKDKFPEFFVRSGKTFSDWILSVLLIHPSGTSLRRIANSQLNPMPCESGITIQLVKSGDLPETDAAQKERLSDPSWGDVALLKEKMAFEYPFKALQNLPAKVTASSLNAKSGLPDYSFSSRPAFLSKGGMSPAQRGTALHRFMQYCDYEKARINPETEINRLKNSGFLTKEQAKVIEISSIKQFFKSGLYTRIKASENVMREKQFTLLLDPSSFLEAPDGLTEKVVVQGICDCAFTENNSLVVVDFKTDQCKDIKELAEKYRTQLTLYAKSLSEITGLPAKETVIYSFHLGKSTSMAL